MPRLKDVTKGEGIGYKDRNFMDWDGNILVNPGYFASNSDFRKNYKNFENLLYYKGFFCYTKREKEVSYAEL